MAQRVAVVTGGMGGLGEAICVKLSAMGDKVVATYSPGNKKSSEWVAEMKKTGHNFYAVPVDVTDFDSCQRAIAEIAYDLSFADPSHFARFFRKQTGKTPQDFRQGRGR